MQLHTEISGKELLPNVATIGFLTECIGGIGS